MKINLEYSNIDYKIVDNIDIITKPTIFTFRICSLFTKEENKKALELLKNKLDNIDLELYKKAYINNFSNHNFTIITHFAYNIDDIVKIIVIDNNDKLFNILNFLTTTDTKQIWYNSIYYFNHIYKLTYKIPNNFVDLKLLIKNRLNNTDNYKSVTDLNILLKKPIQNKPNTFYNKDLLYDKYELFCIADEVNDIYKIYNKFKDCL